MRGLLRQESGFTLAELVLAILVTVIVLAGVSGLFLTRLGSADRTAPRYEAAAKTSVQSAIAAAGAYYQDTAGGDYSYERIDRARLNAETPGIARIVKAAANASGDGYCVEASADGGAHYAWYDGGDGGSDRIDYGKTGCDASTYPSPH